MTRVICAYSQQLYVDGFFNADPHAGNLLVSLGTPDANLPSNANKANNLCNPSGGEGNTLGIGFNSKKESPKRTSSVPEMGRVRPVLLDFGMTITLPLSKRVKH